MVIVRLAASYGDIPVAAYGIVKRIDQFPLGISMGLCQGFMPLVGYNYAAKNHKRMRQVSVFSWKTAMAIAAGFVVCFLGLAPWILHAFYSRDRNQHFRSVLSSHRLFGGSPHLSKRIDYLHIAGHGKRFAIIYFKSLPPRSAEHPLSISDELAGGTLRNDMGAADY